MNPTELVTRFIEEKLEGDIWQRTTFPLGNLRNDDMYGYIDESTEIINNRAKIIIEIIKQTLN